MGQVDDALKEVNAQLTKAKGEILDVIGTLEQQIADNAVQPETLDSLKSLAQGLDDIVPDVPTEPPAEPTG